MAMLMLQLCLWAVLALTSSQPTYDVIQQENDVSSCGRTDAVLRELSTGMSTGMSQIQTAMSQLAAAVSRIEATLSQLQSEVAQLKALDQQTAVSGMEFNTKQTLN